MNILRYFLVIALLLQPVSGWRINVASAATSAEMSCCAPMEMGDATPRTTAAVRTMRMGIAHYGDTRQAHSSQGRRLPCGSPCCVAIAPPATGVVARLAPISQPVPPLGTKSFQSITILMLDRPPAQLT